MITITFQLLNQDTCLYQSETVNSSSNGSEKFMRPIHFSHLDFLLKNQLSITSLENTEELLIDRIIISLSSTATFDISNELGKMEPSTWEILPKELQKHLSDILSSTSRKKLLGSNTTTTIGVLNLPSKVKDLEPAI